MDINPHDDNYGDVNQIDTGGLPGITSYDPDKEEGT